MCGAVCCFAALDACAKWLSRSVDPVLVTWARYVSAVLFVSCVLNPWTRPRLLHSNRLGLQIVRSGLLFLCTLANFIAIRYLQLTETMAIQFAMPLCVALLAGPILGEWAGPRRLAVVLVGFVGVLVVMRPGFGTMHPAMLLSLVNAVAYALYAIITRSLAGHDPPATTITYGGLAGVVLLAPAVPFVWTTPSDPLTWTLLGATGFFGAVGHGLLTLAHTRAPAPVLSPFIYTQIAWMALLGYVVFGDVPDRWTVVGAAIVIASGLYLLAWERGRARR